MITKGMAKEFYRDLCGTVYGNANKNCQGVIFDGRKENLLWIKK